MWLSLSLGAALWSLPATARMVAQSSKAATPAEQEAPMARTISPDFLVATIKPTDPAETRDGFPTEGHRITCINETVITILSIAYGIHPKQIVDAPEWLHKEHFDVDGIPDAPGVPSLPQMQEMYQKLLAKRFHLVFHREQRNLPIYAITVAKGGPILKVADPAENVNTGNSGRGGQRTLRFTNMSMPDFALNMNFYEDRPVIDQTHLPARYDFNLSWTYDVLREGEPGAPPSLFTAIKEQLGLRLDAVKGPAEVLVIDHVEQPSAN